MNTQSVIIRQVRGYTFYSVTVAGQTLDGFFRDFGMALGWCRAYGILPNAAVEG